MARLDAHHGRSRSAASTIGNAAAAQHRKLLTGRKKPSYKVVIEQVQKKKELITAGSVNANPPKGYTFIPAGDPQVTNRCKELALADGAKVYIVSTSKPQPNSLLAPHVHRIGYHFPSYIVGNACSTLGVTLNKHGRVTHHQDGLGSASQHPEKKRKSAQIKDSSISSPELTQAAIDTQARNAIKDLFPNIPDKDMHEVVRRAFEKGKNLVGTSFDLPLQRRVQLAVVAHIRHIYTDYDKLLREVPWLVARRLVEQQSLDVVAKWIKEVNNTDAYEDILREVIVIPDDDRDDGLDTLARHQRQKTISLNSPETTARPLSTDQLETRLVDYGARQGSPSRYESPDPFERGQPLGHGQYVMQQYHQDPLKSQQIGIRRQQLWEQALDRRIKEPETYRVIREGPREHPPLALRTIEAHYPSNASSHTPHDQAHYAQQHTQAPLHPVPFPNSALRVTAIHPPAPQSQHGTSNESRVTQTYGNDRLTIAQPVRPNPQAHPISTSLITSNQNDGASQRVRPYQTIDQRLVSSHQPLRDPSKHDYPYFQNAFVEKLVPSIEGSLPNNGQANSVIVAQRPLQDPFTTQISRESVPSHQPALQRVVSHANDHVNIAKRRRTDDVGLQDHAFRQANQQPQRLERLALMPVNESDRQVEYINYGDIRQKVGETRLLSIKESVPSSRPSLEFRDQGNWERFSSNNHEKVLPRPTQHHEAPRHALRISTSYVPVSSHDPNLALRTSQTAPFERTSLSQRPDRALHYVQHSPQKVDPVKGRPTESGPLTQWEDPRREVIVIDSPEFQRTTRVVPSHDDAGWSTRVLPIRGLQTHGNHYEPRPATYMLPAEGNDQQNRILLQNGETLHRYNCATTTPFQNKQEVKPELLQQDHYVISPRRNTMEERSKSHSYTTQQQQPHNANIDREGRWPAQQESPLKTRVIYHPDHVPQRTTELNHNYQDSGPSTLDRGRRIFDARTGREIIVLE